MANILHELETISQYFTSLKQSQLRPIVQMEFTSTVFDIEHLPGARMPADFLSRIVDKEDSTAPDLEDDSHLVFALTSDDVSQQDTAQFVRPSRRVTRIVKRRTCIITLTNCHDPDRQEHTNAVNCSVCRDQTCQLSPRHTSQH